MPPDCLVTETGLAATISMMGTPEKPTPSPQGLALTYLRSAFNWSKARLAHALGLRDAALLSVYERGMKSLTREQLDSLVEPLGQPPEAVDVLLFAHGLIFPEPQAEAPSPVALSPEEHRMANRAAMAAGWTAGQIAARDLRAELVRRWKQEKVETARREAEELFQGLMVATPRERSALVEAFPDYWHWALAVRLCEVSVKRGAHKAGEALEFAELALSIAERVPGEKSWCSRLTGYCWAHIANARRVSNDYAGADEAFARAWGFWQAGDGSGADLLAEWVLPSMEASLRRAQRRLPEALQLLERARNSQGGSSSTALAYLLLQKENIFIQMGYIEGALAALAEAAPFVEASGDPRKIFALRFNMVDNLCRLKRYSEAEQLLPQICELAIAQANDLDLIRSSWLAAKVAAGQGRIEEAIAGLEQVSRDFTNRQLSYSAALSSLDLAVLRLQVGCTAEVKRLAVAMGWIFKAQGIHQEALAALKLFCDAALQESATEELARRVMAEIEKVRRSAFSLGSEKAEL